MDKKSVEIETKACTYKSGYRIRGDLCRKNCVERQGGLPEIQFRGMAIRENQRERGKGGGGYFGSQEESHRELSGIVLKVKSERVDKGETGRKRDRKKRERGRKNVKN